MTKTIVVEKEVYESVLRVNCNKIAECERLQKQLVIALEALEAYTKKIYIVVNDKKVETVDYADGGEIAEKALKKIRELNK